MLHEELLDLGQFVGFHCSTLRETMKIPPLDLSQWKPRSASQSLLQVWTVGGLTKYMYGLCNLQPQTYSAGSLVMCNQINRDCQFRYNCKLDPTNPASENPVDFYCDSSVCDRIGNKVTKGNICTYYGRDMRSREVIRGVYIY